MGCPGRWSPSNCSGFSPMQTTGYASL
jgi:hypothetical protein